MNLNEYTILKLISEAERPLFFREISKLSKVSIGGTQKVLERYKDYLNKKVEGRNTYFSIKKNILGDCLIKQVKLEKLIYFLKKYPKFKEFFNYLIEEEVNCLVFGSYAKLNPSKDSDLDLLVVSNRKLKEHLCPGELHLISLSESDFKKGLKNREAVLLEIINNHIIIRGFDFFVQNLK